MRIFLSVVITVILIGCKKEQEQLEKFVYDMKQVSYRSLHSYEFYPDGKIKLDKTQTYYYRLGSVVDTIISSRLRTYNSMGKLISVIDLEDSTREERIYNELDSLTGSFRINEYGDTSFLDKSYYKDGLEVKHINRLSQAKLPEDWKNVKKEDFRKYDTTLSSSEMVYKDRKLESIIEKDSKGNVTEVIQMFYENNKKIKSETYSFIGSTKYLSETTYYKFEPNVKAEPDYFTLNTEGDTIQFMNTIIKNRRKIVIFYFGEIHTQIVTYYDEQGHIIADASINLINKSKDVTTNKYDNNGHLVESTNYREKL